MANRCFNLQTKTKNLQHLNEQLLLIRNNDLIEYLILCVVEQQMY